MQIKQLLNRSRRRRIDSLGNVRKADRIEHMDMAVTSVARELEIDRGAWDGRMNFESAACATGNYRSSDGAKPVKHFPSGTHGGPLYFYLTKGTISECAPEGKTQPAAENLS
jgi:hypothetical protein